jgi:hypothetical protein
MRCGVFVATSVFGHKRKGFAGASALPVIGAWALPAMVEPIDVLSESSNKRARMPPFHTFH